MNTFAISLLLAMATAAGAAVPPSASTTAPTSLQPLGKNAQGYECYRNGKDKSVLIYIPAGSFSMGREGSDGSEAPAHTVQLSGYYLSKYEVTWGQYAQFCSETGRKLPERPEWATNKHPVANVTWQDAADYCAWAGLRLPSEAEWERAARGNDDRTYPWGEDDPSGGGFAKYGELRCYLKESDKFPSPVGSYARGASPVGALDMSGNVAEWCSDWYERGYYKNLEPGATDPRGPASGSYRSVRGGAWTYDLPKLKTTNRFLFSPNSPYVGLGFRPARSEP